MCGLTQNFDSANQWKRFHLSPSCVNHADNHINEYECGDKRANQQKDEAYQGNKGKHACNQRNAADNNKENQALICVVACKTGLRADNERQEKNKVRKNCHQFVVLNILGVAIFNSGFIKLVHECSLLSEIPEGFVLLIQ